MCSDFSFYMSLTTKYCFYQYFTEANEADSWMNDKAGLAANQDYGKDELSAEKLLTRHTALQTAVDTYSPIIQGLAEQARKLVQSGHFAASKIASRQVKYSRQVLQVSVYNGAVAFFRVVSGRSKTYLYQETIELMSKILQKLKISNAGEDGNSGNIHRKIPIRQTF